MSLIQISSNILQVNINIVWSFKQGEIQVALVVTQASKTKPPADAKDVRHAGWSLGQEGPWRKAPDLPQHSCLEDLDRGAWRAEIHRVTDNWAWLERLSMHARSIHAVFKVLKLIIYLEESMKLEKERVPRISQDTEIFKSNWKLK